MDNVLKGNRYTAALQYRNVVGKKPFSFRLSQLEVNPRRSVAEGAAKRVEELIGTQQRQGYDLGELVRELTPAAEAVRALSGCSIFRRPSNQFYSLETIPAAGPMAAISGPPIGVDGVELPPTMARRGIVVRDENGKLEVRGTHQWAAPLEDMVVHTIAFNLANRLPEGAVILPGQPRPAAASMRALFVVFEELAPNPEGVFVLDARWVMAAPGTVGEPRHERITLELESMESPAVVTTMSGALAMLTERIIAAM